MENNYVCPTCRTPLTGNSVTLVCPRCRINYPIRNGIPDFVLEDLAESEHQVLRSISLIDKLAKIYESPMWYPVVYHIYGGLFIPSVKEEVEMITEMVDAENGLGLDVACGTGLFTRSIARKMRNVYGIDISRGMLEKAAKYAEKEELHNIRLACALAHRLPFQNELFDGVVCCGALHLFPDTKGALAEIGRVMKRSAILAVMTFVKRRFLKFKMIHEHLRKDHGVHVFEVDELNNYLTQTGFKNFRHNIFGSMMLFQAERS